MNICCKHRVIETVSKTIGFLSLLGNLGIENSLVVMEIETLMSSFEFQKRSLKFIAIDRNSLIFSEMRCKPKLSQIYNWQSLLFIQLKCRYLIKIQ